MPAYYTYECAKCGFKQERYRNVRKCPKCGSKFSRIEPCWKINIGDNDIITMSASNLGELERKINRMGEFNSSMINSVNRIREDENGEA